MMNKQNIKCFEENKIWACDRECGAFREGQRRGHMNRDLNDVGGGSHAEDKGKGRPVWAEEPAGG